MTSTDDIAGLPAPGIEPNRRGAPPRRPIEPGTRAWDEFGLVTFTLSGGAAFLLQAMEPSISAVVDEHSTFRTDPVGRALRSTASVMTWIYGGEEALAEADRLREMHTRLNSVDAQGTKHTALSALPWAWVLLSGIYSMLEAPRYFARRPYTDAEKDEFYQEFKQVMRNHRVVEREIPATYSDLVAYIDDVIENRLLATGTAEDFLHVLHTPSAPHWLPKALKPAWRIARIGPGELQYLATVGVTPEAARRKLGIHWTAADERRLRAIGRIIARTVALLPERLRYLPIAYEARRVERDRQRLRRVLARRPM